MSKKYFTVMNDEIEMLQDYQQKNKRSIWRNNAEVMAKSSLYKTHIRCFHMVKAFCRNVPLSMVECGNYKCGNFRKSLKEAVFFMKTTAGNKETEKFLNWVNKNLIEKEAGYTIVNKFDINVKDL